MNMWRSRSRKASTKSVVPAAPAPAPLPTRRSGHELTVEQAIAQVSETRSTARASEGGLISMHAHPYCYCDRQYALFIFFSMCLFREKIDAGKKFRL